MQLPIMILMITFIIIFIIFIFYLILSARQEKNLKTVDNSGKVKAEEYEKKEHTEEEKVANKKDKNATNPNGSVAEKYKKEDVYRLMEFDRILDDMIVQKNGQRFTMAIQCKGINYDLMSEVEQLSVEEGFITFLNTLRYPIQLYVQAQNIDLKSAIDKYKTNINPLKEEYTQVNDEYIKISSAFDADENEVNRISKRRESVSNVYEYATDIISYVEKMSLNKNLLQRKFFILVSYNTSDIPAVDKFSKDELVSMCSTELSTRCRAIISALASCSVSGKMLNSNELADLLYSAYNRDDKGILSVKEAIESGFFRLYSTSEDAFTKRQNALDEYIKNEAKLRALRAMKDVIENGPIETPAAEMIEQEEEISRKATNLVKNSNYDPEFEENVNKKILHDFKETKRELQEIDKAQQEEIKEQYRKDLEEAKNIKLEKPEGVLLMEKAKRLDEEERFGKKEEQSLQEQPAQQTVPDNSKTDQTIPNQQSTTPVQNVQPTNTVEQPINNIEPNIQQGFRPAYEQNPQPVQQPIQPVQEQPVQQPVQPVQQPVQPVQQPVQGQPTQQPAQQGSVDLYSDDENETIM